MAITIDTIVQLLVWPTINDETSAKKASRLGYWAATVLALLFSLSGTLGALAPKSEVAAHIWDWVDAGVFIFIGWNIRYHSRKAAIFGALCCAGELYGHFSWLTLPFWLLMLLWAVNGVRGTHSLRTIAASTAAQRDNAVDASADSAAQDKQG